jgi:hypothetical protein
LAVCIKPERTSLEHLGDTSPEHFTKKFWRSEHSIVAFETI